MNEAETRAEYIDPLLAQAGWGSVEDSRVLREHHITEGRIQVGGTRGKKEIADYILVYKNQKLAVIEAKALDLNVSEGVAQAKAYAQKLSIRYTYATNGRDIYAIDMDKAKEGSVDHFPTPIELWDMTHAVKNDWQDKFDAIPFEDVSGTRSARYYQEIAVNKTMKSIADGKQRILLTLATGTGKTFISFQIAWKLFKSRWNLSRDGVRQPRILFLADRNILADQAFNAFSAFPQDALVRINPADIRKKGGVPTNASIFFTIFQTFMTGPGDTPHYGDYPADFFDFIIIDECHRGGANDESTWRAILEYFSPAVHLGLTATPKRIDNVDTYKYFGEPVYTYSLKDGINDGFLTPFKVKRVKTTLDDYMYVADDNVVDGEVEEGKLYQEADFNKIIEIKERENFRVQRILEIINRNDKTIIFCATQDHALAVRDLVNELKSVKDVNYCVRVTANDGARGEQFLRDFQDNEKTIPTILTTSQKLSTGVDARNIRNIVLMRPVNSMIEFKQIVGRGTRLFEGKEYFTMIDFVDAYKHFADPAWDGEPIDETTSPLPTSPIGRKEPPVLIDPPGPPGESKKILKIKLRDGKERDIQYMVSTSFWDASGKPIPTEEFLRNLFGELPEFCKSEEELRRIWSNPITRQSFLDKLRDVGHDKSQLEQLQKMIDAEKSDLFDVLAYVSFALKPITRAERVNNSKKLIYNNLESGQKEFLDFVLSKYVENGVDQLSEDTLPKLLHLKYYALQDAEKVLGGVEKIRSLFINFQKNLYMSSIPVQFA